MFESRERRRNSEKSKIFDLLSKLVLQLIFILDQSATTLHKARENWTCKGVTLISHEFSFYVFTEFYFKTSQIENNKSLIGWFSPTGSLKYCVSRKNIHDTTH